MATFATTDIALACSAACGAGASVDLSFTVAVAASTLAAACGTLHPVCQGLLLVAEHCANFLGLSINSLFGSMTPGQTHGEKCHDSDDGYILYLHCFHCFGD